MHASNLLAVGKAVFCVNIGKKLDHSGVVGLLFEQILG
jgi:hypothetical protein